MRRIPSSLLHIAAIAIILATVAISSPSSAHEKGVASPQLPQLSTLFGGAFSLVDHDGRSRTDRDFLGKFQLINFGYMNCPDICPTGLTNLATALDSLEHAGNRVQPLFITIDPARDTPEKLKAYVRNFHPRLIGLTGSEAQIRKAAKAYRIHRSKVIVDNSETGYLATHTPTIFLMAPDGKFLTLFPHDTEPQFMVDTIRRHMAN